MLFSSGGGAFRSLSGTGSGPRSSTDHRAPPYSASVELLLGQVARKIAAFVMGKTPSRSPTSSKVRSASAATLNARRWSERPPRAAAGMARHVVGKLVGCNEGPCQSALAIAQRPLQHDAQLGLFQGPQRKDAAAREQRRDHLERGVLGGGADERDG